MPTVPMLQSANADLQHQIEALQGVIRQNRTAEELTPFREWVDGVCEELSGEVGNNLRLLDDFGTDVLSVVFDRTWLASRTFDLFNTRFAPAVTRGRVTDRLGLLVLGWLHRSHPATTPLAFGLTDGQTAVYPPIGSPSWTSPLYLIPASRQQTLLHIPLVFHEYGHILYALHQSQMQSCISTFETHIQNTTRPRSAPVRNLADLTGLRRCDVVERIGRTWVQWVQEFFCDAVGLCIGGPGFLHAFSHYFRVGSREECHLPVERLLGRSHPLTWLRIRVLVDRAANLPGSEAVAMEVGKDWERIAQYHNANRDIAPVWQDEWMATMRNVLDQMLQVATPRRYASPDDLCRGTGPRARYENPVQLCNAAWCVQTTRPSTYRQWEVRAVRSYLRAH